MKINIKNADKIPQFSEEIVHDSSLDIIEEHSDLEGFSKKLGVKFTDDKGGFISEGNLISVQCSPHWSNTTLILPVKSWLPFDNSRRWEMIKEFKI